MAAIASYKSFKGGYLFKPFKGEIESRFVNIPVPKTAIFPMRQGYGEEVRVLVEAGETIKAGQVIGRDDGSISTPVVSSVSGKVREIGKVELQGVTCAAVEIESNGNNGWQTLPRDFTDYKAASAEQIEKVLYEGGITALGKWGLPTHHDTAAVAPESIRRIVISAVSCEPFQLTNQVLLSNSLTRFATGCEILRKLYKPDEMHLGMSGRDQMLVQKMRAELSELKIEVHELVPKHPQACNEIIVLSCLRHVVPDGGREIDDGILVVEAQTVLHIHDAVVEGKPLIERAVALGGGAYAEPCAAMVSIGTPVKDIVEGRLREGLDARVIFNSSLTGRKVEDWSTPVDRSVSAVIALEEFSERRFMQFVRPGADYDSYSNSFVGRITGLFKRSDTNLSGELRACISCGYCEEVCPRDLLPYFLSKCINADLPEEAEMVRIFGCIECGLCSYVCPSKIPLMDDIVRGKELIIQEEEELRKQLEKSEEERRKREEEEAGEEQDA